jgi:hypothetical protein
MKHRNGDRLFIRSGYRLQACFPITCVSYSAGAADCSLFIGQVMFRRKALKNAEMGARVAQANVR